MNPLTVFQLAVQYGPIIKGLLDEATSNDDLAVKIQRMAQPLAATLTDIGQFLFPKAKPALFIVGGTIAAFDPNITKWLQGALNLVLSPSPQLVVDGLYGPKTRDAVERLQAQLGLTVDGLAGHITQAAIQAALAKLGGNDGRVS